MRSSSLVTDDRQFVGALPHTAAPSAVGARALSLRWSASDRWGTVADPGHQDPPVPGRCRFRRSWPGTRWRGGGQAAQQLAAPWGGTSWSLRGHSGPDERAALVGECGRRLPTTPNVVSAAAWGSAASRDVVTISLSSSTCSGVAIGGRDRSKAMGWTGPSTIPTRQAPSPARGRAQGLTPTAGHPDLRTCASPCRIDSLPPGNW